MTPPSEAPAGQAIEAARPKDFVASDHAYEIARGVRGCTTDEQYMDLQWRIDCALLSLRAQNERMRKALNTPELHDFSAGVVSEAQHQRERWGADSDAGKTPADWFWLVGYLAGKALTAANSGNTDKALHHCISTAAALANWHAALSGIHSGMRPGIEEPKP